jgi:hypothetical protein
MSARRKPRIIRAREGAAGSLECADAMTSCGHCAEQLRILHAEFSALRSELHALTRTLNRLLVSEEAPQADEEQLADLLDAIYAVLRTEPWTCQSLLQDAADGTDIDSARLRALLREISGDKPKQLGIFLRSRANRPCAGLVLHRLSVNREGSRLWEVRRLEYPATPSIPSGAK